MIASVLTDIALVIAAVAALAAVVLGRSVRVSVREMAGQIDSIDHATNQQPREAPTLPQRLDAVERTQVHHSGQIAAVRTELTGGFAAVHDRLDGFLATEEITAQFTALAERLDQLTIQPADHTTQEDQ